MQREKLRDLELPLYKLGKRLHINPPSVGIQSSCHVNESQNDLDMLLLAQWEDRASQGLLKYDVTACETKIIPGSFGFIAQLNELEEWHLKKQPAELQANQVLQPFDPSKFNFTKVGQCELLFSIKMSEDENCELIPKASVKTDDNLVIMNIHPIEYGHVLLVPRALCCLPQMIDINSFELVIEMAAAVNNCFFRIGYNSLGAFATVNHLHFQAYYLANPLPVEVACTQLIPGDWQRSGLKIFELVDYPVKGLLFEIGQNLGQMAEVVATLCCSLQNINTPFNILISDCGTRIFLFPQCYADKRARGMIEENFLQTKVNPSVWEIGGHIVFNRNLDYSHATEQFVRDFLAVASLNHEEFEGLKFLCTGIAERICCQY
ncbi:hypothetical protein SUGI_1126720 [Cryptomeria japonica]|nr:hypothetical protein SUGI_1126720 [Cryptomeria japonica]